MILHDNKQFSLLRRFSITSLVAMLVTASILVLLYRQDQLVEHDRISVQLDEKTANQFIRSQEKTINSLAAASAGLVDTQQALRNNPNIALLTSALAMTRDSDILKLRIFNRSGMIIYSPVTDEIGASSTHHPDLLAKALSGESIHKHEFRESFVSATGEMRDIHLGLTYMPLVDAGKRIGAIEIYRDVTPLFAHLKANTIRIPLIVFGGFALLYAALFFYVRRTERSAAESRQALQDSENLLRSLEQEKLVQTSLDGFWVARAKDGRFLEVNDAFCRMLGYSREELLSMYIADLEADESPDEIAAQMKKVMADGYDRFERRRRHKQGHLRTLEISASYSERNGGEFVVFARDITERKCMEHDLAAREQEFRTLAENMPDTLIRYDREGRRTYINLALKRISAVREEQMIGLTQQESNPFVMPESYRLALEHTLATGERSELELSIPTPSGDRANLISIVAERASDGQISGAITIGRDITERKRMELDIAAREREFRSLTENLPDNIIRYNMEGRAVYVNPALERILGAAVSGLIGTTVREYFADGNSEDYAQLLDSVLASGEAGEMEMLLPGAGGKLSEVHHVRIVPERDGNGEMIGALAIGRDITERKQLEKELLDSSNFLTQIINGISDPIFVKDRQHRWVLMNNACSDMIGYTQDELLGKSDYEFFSKQEADAFWEGDERMFSSGQSYTSEDAITHGSGELHYIHTIKTPFVVNGNAYLVGVIRDITERRRMEQELIARERESRSLVENLPDNIVRHNREGRTVYVCPRVASMMGAGVAARMIGTTTRENTPDGSFEDYAQLLDFVLASGEAGEIEKRFPGPDGNLSVVHQIRMVPEYDENGKVIGALAIGRDITERKRMEESLRAHESELLRQTEFQQLLLNGLRDTGMTLLMVEGGQITYSNNYYLGKPLGYAEGELAAPMNFLELIHPDDRAYIIDLHRRRLAGEEVPDSYEIGALLKDGQRREYEFFINKIPDTHPVKLLVLARDITERKQAERQIREFSAHLLTVREQEKTWLAREIHDDLGSVLAVLNLRLSHLLDFGLSEDMKKSPLCEQLEEMSKILNSAIAATRRIISGMRPDILDNLGLFAALEWQADQFSKHSGIECSVVCQDDHACVACTNCEHVLGETISINLFRIFQEALTNVARHSGASRVKAEFVPGGKAIVLSISDNGRGLAAGKNISATSYGMRGMRERVAHLGGKIEFDSPAGGGLCVTVSLPRFAGKQVTQE